jgi:futalosine hydrolase
VRILVVAATELEIAPVVQALEDVRPKADATGGRDHTLRITTHARGRNKIDVLVTGVGMVATAAWCSRALAAARYDLAFNFGVCGAFDRTFPPGTVVHVLSDRLPELGAEDGESFLTIQELNLLQANDPPFVGGRLINEAVPKNAVLRELPAADGITVNTVHGNDASIQRVVEQFRPQVESMEGAAFVYACRIHSVPFAQVRAVSNVVERRNRDGWKMGEAVGRLGETAIRILDSV